MPYKYTGRKPYHPYNHDHVGEYYYRPKRSMGLKYAVQQKRMIRARIAMNKRIAMQRLRNKYFVYTPKGGYMR